jgi:site-specific recombinase XerD
VTALVPRPAHGLDLRAGAGGFTDAWLANRRLSGHTRAAYRRDVAGWTAWCAGRGLDPLRASFLDVNAYARALESTPGPRSGRPPAAATVARKLSALASWYDFLQRLGAVGTNPVAGADRPRVERDHSATVGLAPQEVAGILRAAAAATGPTAARTRAVLTLLADLGLRVGELVSLDVADLGVERGHRSVRFVGKGAKPRRPP